MKAEFLRPFANNREYLWTELAWLDMLIHREVLKWRETLPDKFHHELKGIYISDQEIDNLVGIRQKELPEGKNDRDNHLEEPVVTLAKDIASRKEMSIQQGIYLPCARLAQLFALTPFEEKIIIVCLAPELDRKYERLYAYLQDDITYRRPGVDLVMRLLCTSEQQKSEARLFFSHQAPLLRFHIVYYGGNNEDPLLAWFLRLNESVVNFLLENRQLSTRAASCSRYMMPECTFNTLRWSESLKSRLMNITSDYLQNAQKNQQRLLYHFYGPRGTGKKTLASALCQEIGISLLIVDLKEVLLSSHGFEVIIHTIFLEGILQPLAIYLEHFDKLLEDDDKMVSYLKYISHCIDELSWLTFIGTEKAWEPAGLFKDHLFFSIELPMPEMTMRTQLWSELVDGKGTTKYRVNWSELAAKFRLTPGQMKDSFISARNYAHLRIGKEADIATEDLYRGCQAQSNQKLITLARKLIPHYKWADITLPENTLDQLHEICAQVKHRQKVFREWGFEDKMSLGKGLCVLFYGTSGTGKTMAVEIIANDLNLEAYKIDLSTVVSKYIGETEKNLSKIFHEAETSNAILFFDEADALFGKRSEVKDAHDRYANIEINYLLQRMEEFEGLAILATNFRKNIDDAFFRRMHFAVEFPFPEAEYRYKIWKQHFPKQAPLDDSVDFNFLARNLNITGGNIKNIAVNAAFLAASNSCTIKMEHIIHAAYREYKKIGRMCTDTEFAPYHTFLRER